MSIMVEGRAAELLRATNFADVCTLRPDGSVHCVPVWVDVEDGVPMVNTARGRYWPNNLERDPRITLMVQNMEAPYEYVMIRGRVSGMTHDGADAHIDALAKKYMGVDEYPLRQPGEERLIVRVDPQTVNHNGPGS